MVYSMIMQERYKFTEDAGNHKYKETDSTNTYCTFFLGNHVNWFIFLIEWNYSPSLYVSSMSGTILPPYMFPP